MASDSFSEGFAEGIDFNKIDPLAMQEIQVSPSPIRHRTALNFTCDQSWILLWKYCFLLIATGCSPDSEHTNRPNLDQPNHPLGSIASSNEPPTDIEAGLIRIVDQASTVGLNFQYYNDVGSKQLNLPETIGGGVAAFDYDLDGWCDLYFANGAEIDDREPRRHFHDTMFRNQSGFFAALSGAAKIHEPHFTMGCAIGDVNQDGFEDLLVANRRGGNLLLNQGDGTFATAGVLLNREGNELWNAPLMVDINRDGHIDLLLANYGRFDPDLPRPSYSHGLGYPLPESLTSGSVLVFESDGKGGFHEAKLERGFQGPTKCLGLAAVDLDKDLQPEIYVANDGIANLMYSRDSADRWYDIAQAVGVATSDDGTAEASMGVTPLDFGRRGQIDLYLCNYIATKNTLYWNDGGQRFRDVSETVRNDVIGRPYVGWGSVPIDFDLDGWLDLLIANGHIVSPTAANFRMPNQLAKNDEGVLYDVSARSGDFFRRTANGRGVASLDYNNDGIVEGVITYTDAPVSLVVNHGQVRNNWVCLEVVDWQHRPLVGGRIEVCVAGKTTAIPLIAGGSYLSESQRRWTIGLGQSTTAVAVQVHWPDGQVDTWPAVPINSILRFSPNRVLRSPLIDHE